MSGDTKRGGLPDTDDLDAFAATTSNAFGSPRRRRKSQPASPAPDKAEAGEAEKETAPPETPQPEAAAAPPDRMPAAEYAVPVPAPAASSEQAPPSAALAKAPLPQAPAAQEEAPTTHTRGVQVRNLGPQGQRATQCTVMVSANVRDRFAAYQLAKKMEKGREPTNAVVVRRAVLHARKNDLFVSLLETVRHRQQPTDDEDYDEDGLFGEVPARRAERGRMKDSVQQSFRPSYQELEVIDAITAGYGFPSRSDFLDAALDAFLPPLPKNTRGR